MHDVGPGWSTEAMHRQIAGTLTGRVTKWIVLAAALVVTGIMATFSAKLATVQNNEASSLAARVGGVDQGPRGAVRDGRPQRHPDAGGLPA